MGGCDAVIIFYAIDSPTTFKSVSNHVELVDSLTEKGTIKAIAANKCDLENSRRV